jgi:hypothetical protein
VSRPYFYIVKAGDENVYINIECISHVSVKTDDSSAVIHMCDGRQQHVSRDEVKPFLMMMDNFIRLNPYLGEQDKQSAEERR